MMIVAQDVGFVIMQVERTFCAPKTAAMLAVDIGYVEVGGISIVFCVIITIIMVIVLIVAHVNSMDVRVGIAGRWSVRYSGGSGGR